MASVNVAKLAEQLAERGMQSPQLRQKHAEGFANITEALSNSGISDRLNELVASTSGFRDTAKRYALKAWEDPRTKNTLMAGAAGAGVGGVAGLVGSDKGHRLSDMLRGAAAGGAVGLGGGLAYHAAEPLLGQIRGGSKPGEEFDPKQKLPGSPSPGLLHYPGNALEWYGEMGIPGVSGGIAAHDIYRKGSELTTPRSGRSVVADQFRNNWLDNLRNKRKFTAVDQIARDSDRLQSIRNAITSYAAGADEPTAARLKNVLEGLGSSQGVDVAKAMGELHEMTPDARQKIFNEIKEISQDTADAAAKSSAKPKGLAAIISDRQNVPVPDKHSPTSKRLQKLFESTGMNPDSINTEDIERAVRGRGRFMSRFGRFGRGIGGAAALGGAIAAEPLIARSLGGALKAIGRAPEMTAEEVDQYIEQLGK